jgi:hypothetical protein
MGKNKIPTNQKKLRIIDENLSIIRLLFIIFLHQIIHHILLTIKLSKKVEEGESK